MGSQVNGEKKRERERKKKKEEEENRRQREHKKKKRRSLDEWIQQVRKRRRQVFLYKAYYAKH
jgi:hypothetical protein